MGGIDILAEIGRASVSGEPRGLAKVLLSHRGPPDVSLRLAGTVPRLGAGPVTSGKNDSPPRVDEQWASCSRARVGAD